MEFDFLKKLNLPALRSHQHGVNYEDALGFYGGRNEANQSDLRYDLGQTMVIPKFSINQQPVTDLLYSSTQAILTISSISTL